MTASTEVIGNLAVARSAMQDARQLLSRGPANQLFALLAKHGEQYNAPLIKTTAQDEAQRLAGYTRGTPPSAAAQLVIAYLRYKGIPVVPAVTGHVLEPGLIGVSTGFRTGVCSDYACVAMLSAMESMLAQRRPFDMRMVTLEQRHAHERPVNGEPSNYQHAVLLLAPHGAAGSPQDTVLIDPWVERSRPALLAETHYASGLRPWSIKHPSILVSFDGSTLQGSQRVEGSTSPKATPVAIDKWPSMSDLRRTVGTLSVDELMKLLKAGHARHVRDGQHDAAEDVAGMIRTLDRNNAASRALFAPRDGLWKGEDKPLLKVPVYQLDRVPGASEAALYRSSSLRHEIELVEETFAGDLSIALSPRSREYAKDRVAVLEPSPSNVQAGSSADVAPTAG